MIIRHIIRSFCCIQLFTLVCCNYNETSLILRDIFADYDKRVIPFTNGPVMVNMTIVLGILIELKENEQIAAYVISHTQRWYDRRLSWNPDKYRGQKEVIVPMSLVWMPKLFVYNSLETNEMLTPNRADVRVFANGVVKMNLPEKLSCICRIETEMFPFDSQFCAVALASPLLNINEMVVNATHPPKDSYFTGNAEWHLFNITVRHMTFLEEGEYRVEVHYIFHLQRRPVYYLTVIVAPTFLISALSILGIFSPGSSDGPRNEKVSLGLGSLLAMTVLLGIVAGAMPKSNAIPLLGYYILMVICLCAFAVSVSMVFLAIAKSYIQKDEMPTPSILRIFMMYPLKKRRTTVMRTSFYRSEQISLDKMKTPELFAIYGVLEEIADTQRSFRRKQEQKLQRKLVEHEWSRVFVRFDHFFLFFFEVLNLAALAVFLRVAWLPTPALREQIL